MTSVIHRRPTGGKGNNISLPLVDEDATKKASSNKNLAYTTIVAVTVLLFVCDPLSLSSRTNHPSIPLLSRGTPASSSSSGAMRNKQNRIAITNSTRNEGFDSAATNTDQKSSTLSTTKKTLAPMIANPVPDNRYSERSFEDFHDLCVIGAGLSGSVIAERYANIRNQTSLIIERRDHIAGNCYDYIDEETGIRVSKYGAHLFHTYYERVWEYVQKFSDWTKYEHEVLAIVDGKHVPVPVNIDTVNALFGLEIKNETEMDEWLKTEQVQFENPQNSEEMALSRVGRRLYDLIFHPYTIKQWAKEPKELGPEVTARIPVRNNHDGRYFADPHQALPTKGYTAIFDKMMDNPLITVKTNTDFFEVREKLKCGKVYYTGPIDRYFADLGWKKLEYRSLDFERRVVRDIDFFQPKGVVNHPNASTNFTRIVEYKHFLQQPSNHTVLFYEYSNDGGEPYYPVPNPENQDLFKKYQEMSEKELGVTFAGRLANYKYFNMDQTIENALSLFDKDTQSLDLVVSYCDGDDLTWVKEWHEKLKFNDTYVYASCINPVPSEETVEIAKAFTTAFESKAHGVVEGKEGIPFEVAYQIMRGRIKPSVTADHLEGMNLVANHFLRNDIDFGSQSVFAEGNTKLSSDILQKSLESIQNEALFVDFVALPFQDCKSSKCDRNFNPEGGKEFFISHEAIKRFLWLNREGLQMQTTK